MSIFSAIGKLFKKILNVLKKLMKWIVPILLIAGIVIAIFFPTFIPIVLEWASAAWTTITSTVGGWASSAWTWLKTGAVGLWSGAKSWVAEASFSDVLKMAVGAAIILDPEGTASAVGGLVGSVLAPAGSAVKSLLPIALAGIAAYFVFFSDDEQEVVYVKGETYA